MAHPESEGETDDYIRGLKYAMKLAAHIPDCSQAKKMKDSRDYREGFRDGCLNVVMALSLKIDKLDPPLNPNQELEP